MRKKKKHRKLWFFIKLQMVLILIVVGAITYFYVGGYAHAISALRDEAAMLVGKSKEATFRSTQTSVVYDSNSEVLSVLKGEKDIYYLSYDSIPIYAKEAIISIEDKKFYRHRGVDYRAIVRAAWAMIRNGKVTQGGSTITQQLARNIFLTQEKTWERKVEEIYVAVNLEKHYTKDQILEFYLNNIYFANGYYGIEAAARGYFSKSAAEISLSQMAFLCAIPNSPNQYDPIDNFINTIDRRNLILKNMYEDGIISLMEYQTALSEIIYLNQMSITKHNYEETYIYYCATRALMQMDGFVFKTEFANESEEEIYKKNYDDLYKECNARLYTGGYRIYTSFDMEIQEELQRAIDEGLEDFNELGENGIYALQGAGVCIDNETGFVKALVGGRSQEYDGYTLNRAYQSYRQPGSAIKPLLVYTPALDRGYAPDTIVRDEKIENGPENVDGTYSGDMTLRRAVEISKNTVAYKLLDEMTPGVGLSYLKKMGFAKLQGEESIPAIALGGFTNGVSPLEMAEGYATLENNGFYREATCVVSIKDASGNELFQPNRIRTVVYGLDAAWEMTDMLRGVLISGTGAGLGIPDMPCAGKTGTTNDNKDGWFVGYTPYYTCSIWVGYDKPRAMKGLNGGSYPGYIWNDFMTNLHENLEPKEFSKIILGMDEEEAEDQNVIMEQYDEETTEYPEEDSQQLIYDDLTPIEHPETEYEEIDEGNEPEEIEGEETIVIE